MRYGVEGAAAAFTLRTASESVVIVVMACRVSPNLVPAITRLTKLASLALLVLLVTMVPTALATKGAFVAAALALYALSCWTFLLEPEEKNFVHSSLVTARALLIGASE